MQRRTITTCRTKRAFAGLLALALLAVACTSTNERGKRLDEDPPSGVAAEFGSYDRSADRQQRVLVGLLAPDDGQVAYGSVTFRFVYRGTREEPVEHARPGPAIEATYRPLPNVGSPREQPGPTVVAATETRGVYGADGVRFDRPGFWSVLVTGAVDGASFETESSFEVNARAGPGIRAPLPTSKLPGRSSVRVRGLESIARGPTRPRGLRARESAYRAGAMDDLRRDDPEGTDVAGASADKPTVSGSRERPVERIRRSSAGAVIAAGLLGLRDALEGRPDKDEIAIVNDAPEATARDALEVSIDFDHPERSVAIIRRPHGDTEL